MLPVHYQDFLSTWLSYYPNLASRAEYVIEQLLSEVDQAGSDAAWKSSALTYTGSPFEVAFTFPNPQLRYTVCPAPPDMPMRSRLAHCLSCVGRLTDQTNISAELLNEIESWQAKGMLKYGAQIGVRYKNDQEALKLYAEIPEEAKVAAEALAEQQIGQPAVLDVKDRNARPTLIGVNLADEQTEFYYVIENLHPEEIRTLLSRIRAQDRAEELLEAISMTQTTPVSHRLPGRIWGYSYKLTKKEGIAFSLYTFADTLIGPDGWIRPGILQVGQKLNWNTEMYAALTTGIKKEHFAIPRHGIIGWTLSAGTKPGVWLGLAPPL